jgi:HD-GYP domain-containing protein (c-di-GMP phosphodiesterase class II)
MSHNLLESAGSPSDRGQHKNDGFAPAAGFKFGPRKIRTKIFLLVTSLVVAVSAFFFSYFPNRLERHLSLEIMKTIANATTGASLGLTAGLQANDKAAMERYLNAACAQLGEIVYAVVEDDSGLVLASVNRDVAEQDLYRDTDSLEQGATRRSVYRTKTAVTADDKTLGQLYLGFSFKRLIAEAVKEKGIVTAACLSVIFTTGLFVFLFSGLITRPLVQVTRTAEKIAKGDMTQRAKVFSRDEVGLLARTFNTMVDGLEKSYREMEGINRSLEEMMRTRSLEIEKEVAERRRVEKELRLAKDELEHRVEKRTEELSKVNEELSGRVMETRRAEDQLQTTLTRLEKALEGTVRAMSLTIEMRDLYTAGHQRRVSSLAVAIAEELHLPSEKIEGLRLAGVIHDIGKIAMPAELLTKPTRLTKTEFQLLKDHPRIGYDILKNIQFPWPVAHIILQHHERMDGSGYPDGLLGDAILMEARILAVADVVEALSSHRPYRPALGMEKALEEIRRGRGVRYDMRVVDACVKLFKDHRYSFKNENTGAVFQ